MSVEATRPTCNEDHLNEPKSLERSERTSSTSSSTAAAGDKQLLLNELLVCQLAGSVPEWLTKTNRTGDAIELYQKFNPQDAIETVLSALTVGLLNASMDGLERAGKGSGARQGNTNAFKHGGYTREALLQRSELRQMIRASHRILKKRERKTMRKDPFNSSSPPLDKTSTDCEDESDRVANAPSDWCSFICNNLADFLTWPPSRQHKSPQGASSCTTG